MLQSARARRMERRHGRARRGGSLNLVSLMDIFTILVFFLLVNSTDVEVLPNSRDVQLPESIAQAKVNASIVVLIGEQDILVQGVRVAAVEDVLSSPANEIPELKDALLAQAGGDAASADDIHGREVTIMGDKHIPYRLLKKVMATCTASDYGRISLAVLQKGSERTDLAAAY